MGEDLLHAGTCGEHHVNDSIRSDEEILCQKKSVKSEENKKIKVTCKWALVMYNKLTLKYMVLMLIY